MTTDPQAEPLPQVGWGECLLPLPTTSAPRELAAELRALLGAVPDWAPRGAPCPWLARAFRRFAAKPVASVSSETCDLIALVVSQDNSCRYCYGVQRAFFKIFGYSADQIEQLERDYHIAAITPADRAALDFSRRVSRANPRPSPQELDGLLGAGFSRSVVAELAFITGAA